MTGNDDIAVFGHMQDQVTLGDLREWHYIEAKCRSCKHSGRIYPARLRRHPDTMLIADLARRFRCTRCQSSKIERWTIFKIARND